ncbi:MAG: hypothetical protein AAFV95_22225 [Bacteroidota bacterium]
MRINLFTVFLVLLLSSELFAGNGIRKSSCRLSLFQSEDMPLQLRVENDLLNGVWVEDFDEDNVVTRMERIFQFRDFGIMEEVAIYDDGNTIHRQHFWKLDIRDGRIYLDIADDNLMEVMLYEVEQTCEGIILTDLSTGQPSYFEYSEKQPDIYVTALFHNFVGHWNVAAYPYEIKTAAQEDANCGTETPMPGAYLELNFKSDGTYTKWMGSEEAESVERGFWEISDDGQYLVFHVSKEGTPESVYTTQYARIKDVRTGKFYLEHSLTTSDVEGLFCTDFKTFSFQRAFPQKDTGL